MSRHATLRKVFLFGGALFTMLWGAAYLVAMYSAYGGAKEPSPTLVVRAFSGATMGTRYNASVVLDGRQSETEGLQAAVDQRLAEINRGMSTYDPESELSRFNRRRDGEWFPVSAGTAEVVSYALRIAADTQGAFDPTIGPVVDLWGFGPDGRRTEAPTDAEIDAALQRVGRRAVEVRRDPPALRKSNPLVSLDLSAIAKGYASDRVSEILRRPAGGCMVEIGGEVATRGRKPDGSPWRIGIEKPDPAGRALQSVVKLAGDAVATSGDYRNFFEHDGVRYSHTIDPRTGRPVTHDLATVTVRAPTCMQADALATALLVMGPERGYDWAEARGVAALMVSRGDDGPRLRETTAWTRAGDRPE